MKNSQTNNKPMKELTFLLGVLFLLLTITGCEEAKPVIEFEKFRVILPPPVSSGTAAYGVIKNTGSVEDTLIGVSSNAGDTMLHQSTVDDNGIAQMIHIEEFVLKPGQQLKLKPLSYHLMLMNINHEIIKERSEVSINWIFKKSGIITTKVPVLAE